MSRRSSIWRGSCRVLACTLLVHVAHAATPEPEQTTRVNPPAATDSLPVAELPPESAPAAPESTARAPSTAASNEAAPAPSASEKVTGMQGAEYRPTPGGQPVQLNLVDVSLGELIAHMSRLTGKRFIFDSKLKRLDVTVIAPTPVTVDEADEAFLAILAQNGLNVVPHGQFLKVIESGNAARSVPPLQDATSGGDRGAASAAVITQLRRVENVSASDAAGVLESFKSPHGEITVYEPRGLLIITDTRAHVQRLARLLEEIDVGSNRSRLWVQPVHYGQASEYAKQIEQVFGVDPSSPGGLSRVIADEATNSLIIVGHDEAYASLLEFLKRVDVAPVAGGRIHIVPLANAVAEELAQTLTRMLSGAAPASRSPGGATSTADGAASRNLGGLFEGEVRVTADKPTNCLIVMSGAHDYAELRRVIDGLDRSRRQVFIEAVILEVASSPTSSERGWSSTRRRARSRSTSPARRSICPLARRPKAARRRSRPPLPRRRQNVGRGRRQRRRARRCASTRRRVRSSRDTRRSHGQIAPTQTAGLSLMTADALNSVQHRHQTSVKPAIPCVALCNLRRRFANATCAISRMQRNFWG